MHISTSDRRLGERYVSTKEKTGLVDGAFIDCPESPDRGWIGAFPDHIGKFGRWGKLDAAERGVRELYVSEVCTTDIIVDPFEINRIRYTNYISIRTPPTERRATSPCTTLIRLLASSVSIDLSAFAGLSKEQVNFEMVLTVCSGCRIPERHERRANIIILKKWGRLVRFVAQEDGQEHIGEPVDEKQDGKLEDGWLAVSNE